METTGTTALATCDFYAQIAMLKPPLTAARIWRKGGGELAEVVKLVNTERLNRSEPNGSYGFKSRPQYQTKERPRRPLFSIAVGHSKNREKLQQVT